MQGKDDELLKKLFVTFMEEAREHLDALSSGFIELEKTGSEERRIAIIETVFRETHSLKGAARVVNLQDVESVCQSLENVLSMLKRRELALSPSQFDVFHSAVDTLTDLVFRTGDRGPAGEKARVRKLIQTIDGLAQSGGGRQQLVREETAASLQKTADAHRPPAEERHSQTDTVRVSASRLNSLLLQAEELVSVKLSAVQRTETIRRMNAVFLEWQKECAKTSARVKGLKKWETRTDVFHKLSEQVERTHDTGKSLEHLLRSALRSAEQEQHSADEMVDNIIDSTKKILLVPCSSLLEIFPRLVRDLSHTQGKDVELILRGGDLEMDRRILDGIRDPLIHIVRNCVDHGIESPENRRRRNKPSKARLSISVTAVGSREVEIVISDDGKGIDPAEVRKIALKLGIISPQEAEEMDHQKTMSLIFHSGFSMSPIITDISGRGLGLAIAHEKIRAFGGEISCESGVGSGTTFRITLPMTFSTSRGVLARLDENIFVIPAQHIEMTSRVRPEEIKSVENRETILVHGKTVPLVPLHAALEMKHRESRKNVVPVAVLSSDEKTVAFAVDEILNEQEFLVKDLGRQLARVRNIAGATVLGNGKVAPILNVHDLIKSAVKVSGGHMAAAQTADTAREVRKSILVVDDSITSRSLIKNILETAGYQVKTAVDGVDAYTVIKTEGADLVVSDVDMPRMNGFDLTAKIRSDRKFDDVPVVLVTALESREDKERGVDVGADAYIVKSRFDQSNLLEVIKRLL